MAETREVLVHLNVDVPANFSDEEAKLYAMQKVHTAARNDKLWELVTLVDPQ